MEAPQVQSHAFLKRNLKGVNIALNVEYIAFPAPVNIPLTLVVILSNIVLPKATNGYKPLARGTKISVAMKCLILAIDCSAKTPTGLRISPLMAFFITSTNPPDTNFFFLSSYLPNIASLNLSDAIPSPIAPPANAIVYGPSANAPRMPIPLVAPPANAPRPAPTATFGNILFIFLAVAPLRAPVAFLPSLGSPVPNNKLWNALLFKAKPAAL